MTAPEPPKGAGRIERLRQGLRRTREGILGRLGSLFRSGAIVGDWRGDLESALLQADLGPKTTDRIVEAVAAGAKGAAPPSWDGVRDTARSVLRDILSARPQAPAASWQPPRVILVVGVNGGGKTTTAGKLARRIRGEGKKVVLCAADTFRAGAGEQLRQWAERAGAEFVGHRPGADQTVARDLKAALASWGAFELLDHGVPAATIDGAFAAVTQFGGPGSRARTSAAARHHSCRGHWSIAQSGRAPRPHRGSRRFDPVWTNRVHMPGGIAHWQGPPSRKRKLVLSRHERSTRSPSSSERYPSW